MVTIKIKENSKQAKAVLEMLKTFPFVEVVEKQRYNATTEKTIRDARAGKGLHKANGTKDLMKQLDR